MSSVIMSLYPSTYVVLAPPPSVTSSICLRTVAYAAAAHSTHWIYSNAWCNNFLCVLDIITTLSKILNYLVHSYLARSEFKRGGTKKKVDGPGNTPCFPLSLPVHQSSVLAVLSTISIRSPVLNDRSPSAYQHKTRNTNKKGLYPNQPVSHILKKDSSPTCAAKSYNAVTYCTGGSALGFGFNGGGGGGARFVAAVALATPSEAA